MSTVSVVSKNSKQFISARIKVPTSPTPDAQITTLTVTVTRVRPSGAVVFSARAMPYDATFRRYAGDPIVGAYVCAVAASEALDAGNYEDLVTAKQGAEQLKDVAKPVRVEADRR